MSAARARPGFRQRFAANRLAAGGALIVALIVVFALAAPVLPLAPPNATNLDARLLPPLSVGHPLGTDQLGRDILARLAWGARVSLAVAAVATGGAALVGSLLGLIAGYFGRWVDTVLMRGIDVLLAFPYMLLALAIVAALGPGLVNALAAVAVVNVPFFARAVRGATVAQVGLPYVAAARLSGRSAPAILTGELLPNVLPTIVVTVATTVGWMILETAGLSFLGLGAQPPTADLGSMLGDGRTVFVPAPHVSIVPGALILILVMGINLAADGVRDAIDPRLAGAAPARPARATEVAGERAKLATPDAGTGKDAPLLRVRGLEVLFDTPHERVRAVGGIDFDLRASECLGLVGESGSGKSVAASSLARLVPSPPGRITAGSVVFDGRDLLALPDEALRALRGGPIAYILQDPSASLTPVLPVGTQLAETIRAHGEAPAAEARRRAMELLDRVQISNPARRLHAFPHELSGGQRQRVAIAMAMANEPALLIADEPTTALDVTTQAEILRLLDGLRRERDMALLFITHDLALVGEMCDRVAVMHEGKIVETGETKHLLDRPEADYTRSLLAAVPRLGRPESWLPARGRR